MLIPCCLEPNPDTMGNGRTGGAKAESRKNKDGNVNSNKRNKSNRRRIQTMIE